MSDTGRKPATSGSFVWMYAALESNHSVQSPVCRYPHPVPLTAGQTWVETYLSEGCQLLHARAKGICTHRVWGLSI